MKYIIIFLMFLSSFVMADEKKISDLEKRISQLESNKIDLPKGLFIHGNVEAYYDDRTYDSGFDSRAEIQIGIQQSLNNKYLNWIGASALYDTYYDADHTKDNTIVNKQIGLGADYYRLYLGETDAQRLGFAKTPKIGAPIIITQPNSRIDHGEKTVLAIGGFQWDNEFEFDSYRLKKDVPFGAVLGFDNLTNTYYSSLTVNALGLFDVSYMRIDSPKTTGYYTTSKAQEGWSIGGTLYRWNIPLVWGVELWDDKDTGLAGKQRFDVGGLYSINENLYVTAHRTEHDDLGYTGNYYGLVYQIMTQDDKDKRPDKRKGLEFGLYLHDKEKTSVYTGAHTDYGNQIIGSIRYKF
jgi:hypothetical protein